MEMIHKCREIFSCM